MLYRVVALALKCIIQLIPQAWNLNWNAAGKPVVVSVHTSAYEGVQTYLSAKQGNSVSTADFMNTLSEEDINYLQVVPEGSTNCSRYPVVKTNAARFNALMNTYMQALPIEKSSSYYFMKSLIEEEHKYLGEALTSLNKAIAMEPTNEVYINHLKVFRTRYNLEQQ